MSRAIIIYKVCLRNTVILQSSYKLREVTHQILSLIYHDELNVVFISHLIYKYMYVNS